ncbi:MAG: hypothetical protein KJ561_01980 [Nanoarchaeota archaeon]|nr:hypothetical protein [Nanoarchaeota archaeon]
MNNAYNIFSRKLKKKSQLTMVIIASFLILITVVSILYITEYVQKERIASQQFMSEEFKNEIDAITNYVDSCIRDTGFRGLDLLGRQGGYIELPFVINYSNNAYWYLDSANIQPTLDEIRERLRDYINQNVPLCSNMDIFVQQGFEITTEDTGSSVDFAAETVFINVTYPITIRKGGSEQEISDFQETYNIRFRRIYELASQIINRHFEPKFDVYHPLELVDLFDFNASYSDYNDTDKTVAFEIADRTRVEYGVNYEFGFISKFDKTSLPSVYGLQENSDRVLSTLDFVVYSPDRLAQLNVKNGTLVSLNGGSVDEIMVEQSYPESVILEDVQLDNLGNTFDRVIYLTSPVYTFIPSGTRFSQGSILEIYWDDELNPITGPGILHDDGSGWKAIPAIPLLSKNMVYTRISHFSNYTPVDCDAQNPVLVKAESEDQPGIDWMCAIPFIGPIWNFFANLFMVFWLDLWRWVFTGGGKELNAGLIAEQPKECVSLEPTCEQTITINKEEKDGEGKCMPEGEQIVGSGQPYFICAKIKRCNALNRWTCKKCKVVCSAEYR